MPNDPFDWVTEPPIREVKWLEFKKALITFEQSAASFFNDMPQQKVQPKMPFRYFSLSMAQHKERWEEQIRQANNINATVDRRSDTKSILKSMSECEGGLRRYYIYDLEGIPAGLMIVQESGGDLWVEYVVTHPLTENCGGILIEFALNLSRDPTLHLIAENERAKQAWTRLGFKTVGGPKMKLDARTSKDWICVGNKWKRKRYTKKSSKYRASKSVLT